MVEINRNVMELAQARFLETLRKTAERYHAMADYQAEAQARAIKTARLRKLRLAKEEAERAAEALKPAAPKKKRPSRAS